MHDTNKIPTLGRLLLNGMDYRTLSDTSIKDPLLLVTSARILGAGVSIILDP